MKEHRKKRHGFRIVLYIIVLLAVGVLIEKGLGDKAKFSVINEAIAPGPMVSGNQTSGNIEILRGSTEEGYENNQN